MLGALLRLSTLSAMTALPLNDFLANSHRALRSTSANVLVVIGNQAADADSCVCAIGMARLLAETASAEDTRVVVPVLAVERADFALQLDRLHLLRRAGLRGTGAGVSWRPSDVSFVDEVDLADLHAAGRLEICLVDHNRLCAPLAGLGDCVKTIVDHHQDEGAYPDVTGEARAIELGIGSCASLVTEQLAARAPALLSDGALCSLLLGAVLLDTANLAPAAKAQKPREVQIANTLLASAAPCIGVEPNVSGRDAYYNELQTAKTDLATLLSFPTADLLRQDYKAETLRASAVACGVASLVVPATQLLEAKPDLLSDMVQFARERELGLCMLMCLDTATRQRQLVVHAADPDLLKSVVEHLQEAGLALSALPGAGAAGGGSVLAFEQGNAKMGRKLLMPLLRAFAVPRSGCVAAL